MWEGLGLGMKIKGLGVVSDPKVSFTSLSKTSSASVMSSSCTNVLLCNLKYNITTLPDGTKQNKSHAVARKPHDANVDFDPYVSNMIKIGPRQTDVVTFITYILTYFLHVHLLHTYNLHCIPSHI